MKASLTAFRFLTIVILFSAPFFASASSLDLLGTLELSELSSGVNQLFTEASVLLTYDYTILSNPYKDSYLFEDILVSSNDIGTTLFTSSAIEPDFDLFASILTNGVDDYLYVKIANPTGSIGLSKKESVWFSDSTFNGVDFVGYSIEQVTLTINSLYFNSPGENPNDDGIWTDFGGGFTINIYGSIPEPTTLLLLGMGAVLIRKQK